MAEARATAERPDDGHIFIEADNLPEVVDAANKILCERDSGVYLRGDVPVLVVDDEALRCQERPYRVFPADADSIAMAVNRCATTYRLNQKTGGYSRVNFPTAAARTILAERGYAYPQLVAVAETPLILPSGELLLQPGYTRDGLLLHFDPQQFSAELFEAEATPDQVDAAVGTLRDLLSGFPFVDKVDEAVAISLLMTGVLRQALPSSPAFGITARAPGTGKTLLQRLPGVLATGRDHGLVSWPDDEVEVRKQILSQLLQGDGQMPIDNVNGVLRSDALCLVLTSPLFTQRMLGGNEVVSVPTRVLVSVNGNNQTVAGDLVRRFLLCRLDAGVERPETRTFRFNPLERLRDGRADYVAACLAITRAYLASGERQQLKPLAGFDEWSRLVREPLVWAGVTDPAQSVEISAQLDPDRQQLEAMVSAVDGLVGAGRVWDVASLVNEAKHDGINDSEDLKRCRVAAREAIEEIAMRGGSISNRALGHFFKRVEGRIVLGRRFVRHREEKTAAGLRWRLDRVDGSRV